MFQFLRGPVLVTALMMNGGFVFAQDTVSANHVMRGCRAWIATPGLAGADDAFQQAHCAGVIEGIVFASESVCSPAQSTNGQAIRIVVKYIDDRPARMHENFKRLAREALQAAWPCKK